jgi:hypothetical protein
VHCHCSDEKPVTLAQCWVIAMWTGAVTCFLIDGLAKAHRMQMNFFAKCLLTRFTKPYVYMYMFGPYVISTLYQLLEDYK